MSVLNNLRQMGFKSHQYPKAIGLWPNEIECLEWLLKQTNPNLNWLEIGSFCGGSACLMSFVKRQVGGAGQIYCNDANFKKWGGIFDNTVYVQGGFRDICHKIDCHSWDLSLNFREPLSFAFIDGWHSYKSVLNEFRQINPLLCMGGIIAFHDCAPQPYTNDKLKYYLEESIKHYNEWMQEPRIDPTMDYHGDEAKQNFCVDEAIAHILRNYAYELIDIPVLTDETHFDRTGTHEYIRGTTSPFNALVGIIKCGSISSTIPTRSYLDIGM